MSHPIYLMSSPVMQQPCHAVVDFGPALQASLQIIHACMREHREHALSANQAGLAERIVAINTSEDWNERALQVFVNPRIISSSSSQRIFMECCPSEPGTIRQRSRALELMIHYQDRRGAGRTDIVQGETAVYLQHTLEHLRS